MSYPDGAAGDAVVNLEVVVEADGTVSTVVVLDGVDPFADQARRAALTWRFAPARRDDTAIAAKIRARVEFHQPKPPAPPASPPPAPAPTSPSATAIEVTVRGARREIGQTTLSAADVRGESAPGGLDFRKLGQRRYLIFDSL